MRMLKLLTVLVLAACGGAQEPATEAMPTDLPVMTLSGPTLEIGAIDGAEEYLFASIASALRLADGTIAVSDPGNTRISIYDAEGTHLRSFGSQGDGPAEFSSLSRIYAHGPDSILATDQRQRTVTAWHIEGGPGDQRQAVDVSGDSLFALDAWLYRRFWIDGALSAEERRRVSAALNELPQPTSAPGYRYVRVAGNGDLWVREPGTPSDETRTWTRVTAAGIPNAVIHAPAAFEPMDIRADEVVGRWTGEADVSFVRAYGISASGDRTPVPAWIDAPATTLPADGAGGDQAMPDEEEIRALVVSSIKFLASAQEIHYASNYSYSTDMDALAGAYEEYGGDFEIPEGIMIDFLKGDSRGWAAVFTHPGFDRACGLAYGFNIPPGWTPGMVMCAPAAGSAATDMGN